MPRAALGSTLYIASDPRVCDAGRRRRECVGLAERLARGARAASLLGALKSGRAATVCALLVCAAELKGGGGAEGRGATRVARR